MKPLLPQPSAYFLALLGAVVSLALHTPPSHAGDLKWSGFASLVAGRTFGPCVDDVTMATEFQGKCTRFIADWSHAAVQTGRWHLDRETRAGLQMDWSATPDLTFTTQVTARTLDDQHLNLEWAYVTYKPAPAWKLQIGRKRLPLYLYSDFQDVGFAYATVRPFPDVYGWDIVNYNGASLTHYRDLGDWALRLEVYGGAESSRKNKLQALFSDVSTDVRWSGIRGVLAEASNDWFTGRVSYSQSDYSNRLPGEREDLPLPAGGTRGPQSFLGFAALADWNAWQFRGEYGRVKRERGPGYAATIYLATLGHQWGKFTLTGGISRYRDTFNYGTISVTATRSLALRYEIHTGAAVKLQADKFNDHTQPPLGGNAKVLTVAYDLVF